LIFKFELDSAKSKNKEKELKQNKKGVRFRDGKRKNLSIVNISYVMLMLFMLHVTYSCLDCIWMALALAFGFDDCLYSLHSLFIFSYFAFLYSLLCLV